MTRFPLSRRPRNTDPVTLNTRTWQAHGLIGWWPLGACPDARDVSFFGNHGSIQGCAPLAGERRALEFSGSGNSGDSIDAGDIELIDGSAALTVCAWIRQTVLAVNESIVAKWDYSTQGTFGFQTGALAAGRLTAYLATSLNDVGSGSRTDTSGAVISPDRWHHVAFVFAGHESGDTARMRIYVDGVAAECTQGSGAVPANLTAAGSATVKIGTFGGSLRRWFNGQIDDVRIYNRPLSRTELRAIHAQTVRGGYGELSILPSRLPAFNSAPDVVEPVASRRMIRPPHHTAAADQPFAGAGKSVYVNAGEIPLRRRHRIGRGSRALRPSYAKGIRRAAIGAQDSSATLQIPSELIPATGQPAQIVVDVVPFAHHVEAQPPSYLPTLLMIDDQGSKSPAILGSAIVIAQFQRAAGVVVIGFLYTPVAGETTPQQFRLRRTAGPTSPGDVVRTVAVNGPTRFNMRTSELSDASAYTFELIGEAGSVLSLIHI